jgi:hypothetical protein
VGFVFGKSWSDPSEDYYRDNWSWSTSCKSDPRFNLSGYASGMWSAMDAVDKAIRTKAKELGLTEEQIPEDIEYGGNK